MNLARAALLMFVVGGCEQPPNAEIGVIRLALVRDAYIFKVIQVVQVHVLKASPSTGLITCTDLRGGKFKVEDPRFEALVTPPPSMSLSGHAPTKEVVIDTFEVPADQQIILLARGLTQYQGDAFAVGQACKEDLIFSQGSSNIVELDMSASTGADCTEVADCEVGLSCQKTSGETSEFRGGYCAKVGCSGDQECPPGSTCISNSSSGICLRSCDTLSDCTWLAGGQAVQDCVGRSGPTGKGCGSVCVYPQWNAGGSCKL